MSSEDPYKNPNHYPISNETLCYRLPAIEKPPLNDLIWTRFSQAMIKSQEENSENRNNIPEYSWLTKLSL